MKNVSIIIPAHNEKENLFKLLPVIDGLSASCQVETIVVLSIDNDDGSENLQIQDDLRFIRCMGKGRAVQMNKGASEANGDVLVFLHADVLPPKSFLFDILNTFETGFEAGFFSYRFDKKSIWLDINASFTRRKGIFTGGGDQCLFIEKETFNGLGRFDENQVIMEDFEFFRRMKKEGVAYKIVKNDLLVSSRKYDSNSYLRVNLSNLFLILLFYLGCSSAKLKSLHKRLINTPYHNEL